MFHFGYTCSKKIIYKKIQDSCHGFSFSWTSCNGIQYFLKFCIHFCPAHAVQLGCRATVLSYFVSRLAHATLLSTTRNSIDQLAWEPCHNYIVPCQGCSTSVGGHRSCRINFCWLPFEVNLFVRLDGEHPSSGHIISRLGLPHVDEIKTSLSTQDLYSRCVCFSKLFVVSSYFLSSCFFPCTGSHFGSCSCCFYHRWPYSVPTCLWFDRQPFSELQLFVLLESLARVIGHFIEVQ